MSAKPLAKRSLVGQLTFGLYAYLLIGFEF
jgi:hypothetical protein